MCQYKVCERFAYPHRKTFWSNKIFHWFNAIGLNGFFFNGTFYVDEMGGGGGGGGVVGVEEAVKYCKLKDCQKDDAQKRW